MREQGVVTRVIPPDVVEVSLQASEACGRCGACHPDSEGRVGIEAVAVSGVKTGDAVEIEISTGGVVTTSFVVYLLPIVFLIAGYIFGSAAGRFLFHPGFQAKRAASSGRFSFWPSVSGSSAGMTGMSAGGERCGRG